MRPLALAPVLLLTACTPPLEPVVWLAGLDIAAVPIFHRTAGDLAYSLYTRRDCSLVRLEQEGQYCKRPEPPPPEQPFCTRTLGMAECFATPATLNDHPSPWGDSHGLNAAQEHDRTARWPDW